MSILLSQATIGGLSLKNRVIMSPMCMYEVKKCDGELTPFHFAHYGARAIGQVGLIILEATAIEPNGRITPNDLGLWNDAQQEKMSELVNQLHELGSKVGIQLQHAGRKATHVGTPVAPSALSFDPTDDNYTLPEALTLDGIQAIIQAFVSSAKRAEAAGFDMIELHGAHGYLIHQFLEPETNHRTDAYGGQLENRARLLREIVREVKKAVDIPVWVRLSATAYLSNQNSIEDYQRIAQWLVEDGVAAIDISTGGLFPIRPTVPIVSGYQVEFARSIKEKVPVSVTAVGLLHSPELAEYLVSHHIVDGIMIGRGLLQQPNWVMQAAKQLHDKSFTPYNGSYARANV